jgi:hypothetical protein
MLILVCVMIKIRKQFIFKFWKNIKIFQNSKIGQKFVYAIKLSFSILIKLTMKILNNKNLKQFFEFLNNKL